MARRIVAMLTMVVLIGLLLVLLWRVYLHHERGRPSSEPAVVAMPDVARPLLFYRS